MVIVINWCAVKESMNETWRFPGQLAFRSVLFTLIRCVHIFLLQNLTLGDQPLVPMNGLWFRSKGMMFTIQCCRRFLANHLAYDNSLKFNKNAQPQSERESTIRRRWSFVILDATDHWCIFLHLLYVDSRFLSLHWLNNNNNNRIMMKGKVAEGGDLCVAWAMLESSVNLAASQ